MRRMYFEFDLYEELKDKNFELEVYERDKGDIGVALYQLPAKGKGIDKEAEQIVKVWGYPFRRIRGQIIKALQNSEHEIDDLTETDTFRLEEEQGVQLGLIMMAVKPLQKRRRIDELKEAVRFISSEECYYWYSLCTNNEKKNRARKAFRILFSEE